MVLPLPTPALTASLLSALISVLPPIPQPQRARIERAGDKIVQMASDSCARFDIPPGVLLVVGYMETHLGTDAGEGGGWGAPVDSQHRHVAGTSDHAARVLSRGFRRCGSWEGALSWFRSGACRPPRYAAPYVSRGVRLILRVYAHAQLPAPDHLDAGWTTHGLAGPAQRPEEAARMRERAAASRTSATTR